MERGAPHKSRIDGEFNSVTEALGALDNATLSTVIDLAVAGEPTVITRDGRKEAVIVSSVEWKKPSKAASFAEVLLGFLGEPGDIPQCSRKPARALRDS